MIAAEVNDWRATVVDTVTGLSEVDLGSNELSLAAVNRGVAFHRAIVTELAGGDTIGSCVRVVSEILEQIVHGHRTAQVVADRCISRRVGWCVGWCTGW